MKPVQIGIIGASGRARLAKNWHPPVSTTSRIVAAADVSPDALSNFSAWAGEDAVTLSDYRDLVSRDDVDAVGIFSPDPFHEEHALAALEAGKHVYLEKPMAISVPGCDRILDAWQRSGCQLVIGFNMRYMPVFVRTKELLDSGAIGDVKAIWVRHFVGAGGDFYFHDWHALRRNSHSLLLQKGSHDFDMIHWLAGSYTQRVGAFGGLDYFGGSTHDPKTCPECLKDPDRATELQAEDNPRQECPFREDVDVEDNHVVILQLENGIKASYLQCHFTPEYLRNYTVIGTKGRLEIEVERNRLTVIPRTNSRTWEQDPPPSEDILIQDQTAEHGGADPLIARDFLQTLEDGKTPLCHPVAGRQSVAVGCAAVESLRNGGMQEVDSVDDFLPNGALKRR